MSLRSPLKRIPETLAFIKIGRFELLILWTPKKKGTAKKDNPKKE